jgi:cytochrome c peroxidase
MYLRNFVVRIAASVLLVVSVSAQQSAKDKTKVRAAEIKPPLGLLPIPWPADNPYSPAKVELGRILYFDKRLSGDATISCASCHAPDHGFTDNASVSTGINGQKGTRNAPTTVNRAFSAAQGWDGRGDSLEIQAIGPISPIPLKWAKHIPISLTS